MSTQLQQSQPSQLSKDSPWTREVGSFTRPFGSILDRFGLADPFNINLPSLLPELEMDPFAMDFPLSGRSNQLARRTRNEVQRFSPILAADFYETDQDFQCHVDLPGVREKDLDVSISDGNLCIKAERHHNVDKETATMRRIERSYGAVSRQIPIPNNVKVDEIAVNFNNGLLEIAMPKMIQGQSSVKKLHIGHGSDKPATPSGSNNSKGSRKG